MLRSVPRAAAVTALVAAAFAGASAGQGPPGGSPPGFEKALAAKEKHAQKLLDTPGVAGVGVGLNRAGKPVIEIYKERDDVPDLPDSLEGVPVESVTTGIIEPRAPTDRFPRPVPIGVSSGLAGVATGTLGARVTDGTNTYALSNNHVFAGVNTASIGDPIIQPGDADGGSDPADRIGTLSAYQAINFDPGSTNTMDAALALTSAVNVGTSTPADGYGAPSAITTQAFVGQAVQKYGRTTGLQSGAVVATNVSVDVCYIALLDFCLQEARFVSQFSISPGPFSAPGDSGSLVVTQGGNQPVGLLFAGGDGLTIATPIDLVLQRFGVTIEGAPPSDGPPSAPTSLTALAGDASVILSWTPPAFDGGSPITGYTVYRGTSPNPTTPLTTLGVQTSYADSGLTNGQPYYYKVSALNANGESALSNEASATPTDLASPVEPLPALDSFNRANETPLSDAGRWSNALNGGVENGLNVSSNQLACSVSTTCTAWRNNVQYGPDSEAWARVSTLPGTGNAIRLYVRVQAPGTSGYDGYVLLANQLADTDQTTIYRITNSGFASLLVVPQELAAGDTILFRADGTALEAWRHDGASWSRFGVVHDSTYAGAGYVGVGLRGTTGRLDDFGARTLGTPPPDTEPPSAPSNLQATVAGPSQIDLTWQAATDNVGVTLYRIERCQGAGCSSFTEIATTASTSYASTGLAASTAYSYQVRAEDAASNLSAYSGTASATTSSEVTPPVEPLPTIDSFNRRNESPLSDAGRWSNGIIGSAETGLRVNSNTLGCTRTTTCTAWRNTSAFGPDTEVWARVTTLPGTGNQLRLYARLQQPGSPAHDGYMLRTNQLSGTDEVYLERLDNSAIVRLATLPRELAVGDVLLLRVKGSTLEAWLRRGTTWSLVGSASDSTYPGAGYIGVGIRGKTGRLDDFGGR